MLSEEGLYIKWWLDDNGGLDAFKGAVELKTNIQGLDDSMSEGNNLVFFVHRILDILFYLFQQNKYSS